MSNLRKTIGGTWRTLAVTAMAFSLFCHATPVFAQAHCWTSVGSDGAVDEADLSTVALSANSASVRGVVASAIVDIRYNVVAVDGIFGGERNTKTLTVRMADNGPAAQVIVRLQQLNISTGVITMLAELDSNTFPPSVVAQRRGTVFNCDRPEFDFQNNIYFFEVQLIKTAAGGNPLIRAIQICGNGIC
jgi:hypothetical protein